MKFEVALYELPADAARDAAPVLLEPRTLEAPGIDEARNALAQILKDERRPIRSIGHAVGGGLVAYVLPPEPEKQRKRRPRRPRRKRS